MDEEEKRWEDLEFRSHALRSAATFMSEMRKWDGTHEDNVVKVAQRFEQYLRTGE